MTKEMRSELKIQTLEKKGVLPEHVSNDKRRNAKYEYVYLS